MMFKSLRFTITSTLFMPFWGSVVGGALGFAGSLLGSKKTADSNKEAADANTAYQKEFAQNGLKWRIDDAASRGISPLAAIGAMGTEYQPSYIGTDYGDMGMSKLGQGIQRAAASRMTQAEREWIADQRLYQRQKWNQDLAVGNLEIQRLERELQNSPPFPGITPSGIIPGQTGINNIPAERIVSGQLGVEKAVHPMQKMTVDKNGRIYFILGKSAEEAMENDLIAKTLYQFNQGIDYATGVARGWFHRLSGDRYSSGYKLALAKQKYKIAKELGLDSYDAIGFDFRSQQFFVKPKYVDKLNK